MQILLASSNSHKLQEINAIWQTLSAPPNAPALTLIGLDKMAFQVDEPQEDQDTFEGNALLKARYYAHHYNMLTLADDSGLEVDALGGNPGVYSARYAGQDGPRHVVDPANNKKLILALADMPDDQRAARFVCALALIGPKDEDHRDAESARLKQHLPLVVRGTLQGQILTTQQAGKNTIGLGEHGFGYDPLFYLPQRQCTSAQLTPKEKNKISHRSQAAGLMHEKIFDVIGQRK